MKAFSERVYKEKKDFSEIVDKEKSKNKFAKTKVLVESGSFTQTLEMAAPKVFIALMESLLTDYYDTECDLFLTKLTARNKLDPTLTITYTIID